MSDSTKDTTSAVVLADKAAELLDHLTLAVEEDVEIPTVIRRNGELREEASRLYLAVDAFHRKLRALAGDDDLHLHAEEPMVAPYSQKVRWSSSSAARQRSHDAALHELPGEA